MNPYSKYKSAAVHTQDSIGQIITVFDETIKLLYQAKKCIEKTDIEGKHNAFTKAYDIFFSLHAGIDKSSGHEILISLDIFLISVINKIFVLNSTVNDLSELDKLIETISGVRDTIQEQAKKEGLL